MKKQCNAHNCWCGNRGMKVSKIIRDNMDDMLLKVDGCGIYIATGGYTEHWADEDDFYQQYPDEKQGMSREKFIEAQEALGLTNQAMADMLCCSLRLVEKMRQGERAVSARTARMIERELQQRGE